MSHNNFVLFPDGLNELEGLEVLDLSFNQIPALPPAALEGMAELKVLNLAHNHIRNWADLEPKVLLEPATQLRELNLASNLLTTVSASSVDENLQLISASLERLDLSGNKITKIADDFILQGELLIYSILILGATIDKLGFHFNPNL